MYPKIFVTGSSGFIARNVIEQLGDKYIFFTPGHRNLDLLDSSAVESYFKKNKYFDAVIHAAIVGGNRKVPNIPDISITNLKMFFNIARCNKYFGRMIHLGSGIEYGKERPLKRISEVEFDKFVPQDNFGFYKYICAKYIENVDSIINLRLFGVFGKYEDASIRFISNAICKSILRMPITIHQNVVFDYLYINDLVKIVDFFLNNKVRYKSYNVGTGRRIDLKSIADKVNKVAGKKSPIKIDLKGLANEYTCDNRQLVKELTNFKFTSMGDAIKELYDWYFKRKNALKKADFLDDHFK